MSFETESLMVDRLKSLITEDERTLEITPPANCVFQELDLGFGIADLVIVSYDSANFSQPIPRFAVNILNLIRTGATSIDNICEITRVNKSAINKAIQYLNDEDYLILSDGIINLKKDYDFIVKSSIAIEAKMHDWKRALLQAYRYKWFANYSFVCLPESIVQTAINNLDLFVKYGIGIMSVNENITYHYIPENNIPIDEYMYISLNEKVKNYLL